MSIMGLRFILNNSLCYYFTIQLSFIADVSTKNKCKLLESLSV